METTSINYINTLGEGLYAQQYSFIYVTCLFEHITDCLGLGFFVFFEHFKTLMVMQFNIFVLKCVNQNYPQ